MQCLEIWTQNLTSERPESLATDENGFRFNSVSGIELQRTPVFKYPEAASASDGGALLEVNSCVSAAWLKWRSLTGVLLQKDTRAPQDCCRGVAEPLDPRSRAPAYF